MAGCGDSRLREKRWRGCSEFAADIGAAGR